MISFFSSHRTNSIGSLGAAAALFSFLPLAVSSAPLWAWRAPGGDAALCVAQLPGAAPEGRAAVVAGFESGAVRCFDTALTSPPLLLWTAQVEGAALALLPFDASSSASMDELIVSTARGRVTCLRAAGPQAGEPLWTYTVTCNVSALGRIADLDGDGAPEVIAGGADQRVHLIRGRQGVALWAVRLNTGGNKSYLHNVFGGFDLDLNGSPDVIAWCWDGSLWALNGKTGATLWWRTAESGFTEACALPGDLTGDGRTEIFVGGNGKTLRLCSGDAGAQLWSRPLDRPVRFVAVPGDLNGDSIPDAVAVTAEGRVAAVSGAPAGGGAVLWNATLGADAGRMVVSMGDTNGDGAAEVAACAENGEVRVFSGLNGAQLGRWNLGDAVRALAPVHTAESGVSASARAVAAVSIHGVVALLSADPALWEAGAPPAPRQVMAAAAPEAATTAAAAAPPRRIVSAFSAAALQQEITEVPILLYHDVLPEAFYSCCSVSEANFRAQMDTLVLGNYHCVTLGQIADWIAGLAPLPPNPVCITFDGPYLGWFVHAAPILRERGLFATGYITTDWIGTANHCDWHQVRALEEEGVIQIENHSINHPALTSVSIEEAAFQLLECNAAIARHLPGKTALHHAYPSGDYNTTVRNLLGTLGFQTATTVVARHARITDHPLTLPRYSVYVNTNLTAFKEMIRYTGPVEPTPTPVPGAPRLPYVFAGLTGSGWNSPSYAEVDAQGRLWVCDYGAKKVRILDAAGAETAFSPISQGQNAAGAVIPMEAPSGVAITPSGEALVTIADYFDSPQYLGVFRYRAADGAPLPGWDLGYKPGEADCDAAGNVFIVDKTVDQWHVYDSDGAEYPGSPSGPATPSHISRGISVTPEGSRVYVISETDGAVHVWNGAIYDGRAIYNRAADLVTELGGASGGVDVIAGGVILVGDDALGRVYGFSPDHLFMGLLEGGSPSLNQPRGATSTPDGLTIWITCRSGSVQRWVRATPPAGLTFH